MLGSCTRFSRRIRLGGFSSNNSKLRACFAIIRNNVHLSTSPSIDGECIKIAATSAITLPAVLKNVCPFSVVIILILFKHFPMPTCHISNTFLYHLSHAFFSKLKGWNVNSDGKRSHKPVRPLISAFCHQLTPQMVQVSSAPIADGSSFGLEITDGSSFEVGKHKSAGQIFLSSDKRTICW